MSRIKFTLGSVDVAMVTDQSDLGPLIDELAHADIGNINTAVFIGDQLCPGENLETALYAKRIDQLTVRDIAALPPGEFDYDSTLLVVPCTPAGALSAYKAANKQLCYRVIDNDIKLLNMRGKPAIRELGRPAQLLTQLFELALPKKGSIYLEERFIKAIQDIAGVANGKYLDEQTVAFLANPYE